MTLTVGLVWWLSAWAFGVKAFDAFMVTVFLVVGAAGYRIAKPFLDQALGREVAAADQLGPPTAPGSPRN